MSERTLEFECSKCDRSFFAEEMPNIQIAGQSATCPAEGCGGRGLANGLANVQGLYQRVEHGIGCEGWVLHELRVRTDHSGVRAVTPALKPCGECSPGHLAVWEAGLLKTEWERNPVAVKAYLEAEARLGRPVTTMVTKSKVWEKVAREVLG